MRFPINEHLTSLQGIFLGIIGEEKRVAGKNNWNF